MKLLISLIVAALLAGGTVAGLVAAKPSSDIANGPANAVIMGASDPAAHGTAGDSCCPPPAGEQTPAVAAQPQLTPEESQIAANLVSQASLTVEAEQPASEAAPAEPEDKAAACTDCVCE